MLNVSPEKLDTLANYFVDVGKGLTLASLAVPVVVSTATILTSARIFLTGIAFLYLALKANELKEVIR